MTGVRPVECRTVAALYVQPKGCYVGVPGVDPWDEARDARKYAGAHPVVAHPPCSRWSRLAKFCEARHGLKVGDDGGCFEAALHAVRTWGGVRFVGMEIDPLHFATAVERLRRELPACHEPANGLVTAPAKAQP